MSDKDRKYPFMALVVNHLKDETDPALALICHTFEAVSMKRARHTALRWFKKQRPEDRVLQADPGLGWMTFDDPERANAYGLELFEQNKYYRPTAAGLFLVVRPNPSMVEKPMSED